MTDKTSDPCGSDSSAELGGDIPGDDDSDLRTRYDMLKGWLVEADSVNGILKKHLGNVLEIAYTWQPGYATKMDRDTLTIAAKSIGYELLPNTTNDRPCHVFTVTKRGSLTEWIPTTMASALPDGKYALYTILQPELPNQKISG